MFRPLLSLLLALPILAQTPPKAFDGFRPEAVRAHIRYLSSDLLEGRGPGTRGDALATNYLASQLEAMGLERIGTHGVPFQMLKLRTMHVRAEEGRDDLAGANECDRDSLLFKIRRDPRPDPRTRTRPDHQADPAANAAPVDELERSSALLHEPGMATSDVALALALAVAE